MATNGPWWFTDSGVVPGPKLVNADSGTIVSRLVLTDGAEEALLLPVAANALVAALREELEAMLAAVRRRAAALCALLDVALLLLLTSCHVATTGTAARDGADDRVGRLRAAGGAAGVLT